MSVRISLNKLVVKASTKIKKMHEIKSVDGWPRSRALIEPRSRVPVDLTGQQGIYTRVIPERDTDDKVEAHQDHPFEPVRLAVLDDVVDGEH